MPSRSLPLTLLLAAVALAGCVSQPEAITPTGVGPVRPPVSLAPPSPLPPPATDAEVAERFHAAVASGDRASAQELGDPAAVAVFEPYRQMFDLVLSLPVAGTFGLRGADADYACTVVGLRVTTCAEATEPADPFDRASYGRFERLVAEPGGMAVLTTGPVGAGAEAFTVEALGGGGDMLDVVLTPTGEGASVVVYDPAGTVVGSDPLEVHVETTTTGDYLVVVAPGTGTYTVSIGISVDAG